MKTLAPLLSFVLSCGGNVSSAADSGIDVAVIAEPCNPLTGGGCGAEEKCTFRVSAWTPLEGATVCVPVQEPSGEPLEECAFTGAGVDSCGAKLWCDPASEAGVGECRRLCTTLTGAGCDSPDQCRELSDGSFADVEFIGICDD